VLCTRHGVPQPLTLSAAYAVPWKKSRGRPCVFVSVCDHIFGTTRPIYTNFLCMLPMAVARSSGGVIVRYVLPVMDDVMFAHKPRLMDVAPR